MNFSRNLRLNIFQKAAKTMSSANAQESSAKTLVAVDDLKSFVTRCMTSVGTDESHALALADVLAAADTRGHFSHGLNRLDMYVNDINQKICKGSGAPEITRETAAIAHVNGSNLLGPVVGNFCMDLAVKKAKDVGVGWVVANGSNHFGIAGWYSIRACKQGLLGMAFTNTSPLQVPTRGKQAVLGTNPISVAAPSTAGGNDDYVLDMATSTAAIGKVELHQRKDIEVPNSWGVDSDGKETNCPGTILHGGGLLPLGGVERTGGYKGYGLAMLVEVFCGILGNAAYGGNVRRWMNTTTEANLGQCFVALDPNMFAPGFEDRMSALMTQCRQSELAEGETEILVAGDPERRAEAEVEAQGGIRYHPNQITFAEDLAHKLGVDPMPVK